MAVSTREQLKQYCLRNLGAPVLEINVDDDQLEDRIDEALDHWKKYHYDGTEKFYLKQEIRPSTIELATSVANTFDVNSVVTGQTSGAVAKVYAASEGTTLIVHQVQGTFANGEDISNDSVTATLAAENAVTLGEFDKKYIETSDWIYGVSRVIPFSGINTTRSFFDVQYQLRLKDLYDLTSTSIVYYNMVMNHLQLLDTELNGLPLFRFNRLQNRIYLDINWDEDTKIGNFLVIECYRALNPAEFSKVWGEPWLRKYTTALFKKQWGTNLKKFSGLQLPGGVILDGQSLYQEAVQEIDELETELINGSAPLEFFVG